MEIYGEPGLAGVQGSPAGTLRGGVRPCLQVRPLDAPYWHCPVRRLIRMTA